MTFQAYIHLITDQKYHPGKETILIIIQKRDVNDEMVLSPNYWVYPIAGLRH